MFVLIWALVFWVGLFALIKWLEVKSKGKISQWLQSRNVSLYLGYVSWTTTRYNSSLVRISNEYRRWWDLWFSLGVTFGLVGLIFSVIVLVGNLVITLTHVYLAVTSVGEAAPIAGSAATVQGFNAEQPSLGRALLTADGHNRFTERYVDLESVTRFHEAAEESVKLAGQDLSKSSGILTPLLPGVNLPKSQLGYILIALLISALFHELGHALAAGAEELRVNGVGGFLALIFPGAYVQIDGVDQLPPWRQLKVYCAGAWHNVAVAISCVVAIGLLPIFLIPFYSYHHGAVVTEVSQCFVLKNFVFPGDVIQAINSNAVADRGRYLDILQHLRLSQRSQSIGFCFDADAIESFGKPPGECCGLENNATSNGYQCFTESGVSPRSVCMKTGTASRQKSCLQTLDCGGNGDGTNRTSCFFPVLPNGHQLMDILIRDKQGKDRHVIFQGTPETLQRCVMLSNYLPRLKLIADLMPAVYETTVAVDIPKKLDRLLQYTFSVSLCLAVLNMAPVFFLDGEASAILFVRIFRPRMADGFQQKLKSMMLIGGTLLLAGNIVVSLAVLNL
mmetsp:Transcript_10997/g.33723  ORF Transcript_10997/g.33723 Transcript_10997/m.33723 type:complete len:562 (+) Transcript_10997:313-1998(+)